MFCRKVTDLGHQPPGRCIEFYRIDSRDIGFDTRKHRHRLTTSESWFSYYQLNGELLSRTIPWQPWTDEDTVCPPTDAADALARVQVCDTDPVQCLFEPDPSLRSTPLLPQLICVAHVTDSVRSCFQLDGLFFATGDKTIRPGTSIVSPAAWNGVVFATRRVPVQALPSDTTIFEAQSLNGDLLYLQTNNSFAEVALPEWVPRFQEHVMHAEPSRVDSRRAEGVNLYNGMPEIYTLGDNTLCDYYGRDALPEWVPRFQEHGMHAEPSRVDSIRAEGVNQYNGMPEIYALGDNTLCDYHGRDALPEWVPRFQEHGMHAEPSRVNSRLEEGINLYNGMSEVYVLGDNTLCEDHGRDALPEWVPRFQEHGMHAEPSRVDSRLVEGVNLYNGMPEIYALGDNTLGDWDPQSREQSSHPEPSCVHSSIVAVSQVNKGSGTPASITAPQPNEHSSPWEGQQQNIDSMDHIDTRDSTENHVRQQLSVTDALLNLESFPDPPEGQRPVPMVTLLTLALRGSDGGKMTTNDLCQPLIDRFTWFKEHETEEAWKTTVRITLRGHPQFVRTGFHGPLKRGRPSLKAAVQEYYWTLEDSRARKMRRSRARKGRGEKNGTKANGKLKRASKDDPYH